MQMVLSSVAKQASKKNGTPRIITTFNTCQESENECVYPVKQVYRSMWRLPQINVTCSTFDTTNLSAQPHCMLYCNLSTKGEHLEAQTGIQ